MEYTTDVSDAEASFLRQNYLASVAAEADYQLQAGTVGYLLDLLALAGKDPDPELVQQLDNVQAGLVTAAASQEQLLARMDDAPTTKTIDAARVEQLKDYVGQLEGTYAQHAMAADIAGVLQHEDEVESNTVAMLQIEGAHEQALAELAALGGVMDPLEG